ncbi:MAG: glycosyltransferase [Deltaproteobacteria bacterium]|nr:glycosyltransferase [Deltaproteobacteria bacterium]
MKIALFLPNLGGGGVERVFVHLARGLAERGETVELVLASRQGVYLAEVPAGVTVRDLGVPRVLRAVLPLARYLGETRPDVLLTAQDHANVVAVAARALARTRWGAATKLVLGHHSSAIGKTAAEMPRNERVVMALVPHLFGRADRIVAVAGGVADRLAEYARLERSSLDVVYNPIITPELFQKAAEPTDHPWLQPGQPPVVLGCGRLVPDKDYPTLLRAFALVRRELPARLLLLGEGPERPRLLALATELGLDGAVELPGFFANPYGMLKQAALFVQSSVREALPTVLVESLALGTPVVATRTASGTAEILQNAQFGPLGAMVPCGDPQALAQAILQALRQPPPPAPVEALEPFQLDTAISNYLTLLRDTCAEPRPKLRRAGQRRRSI